jgi:hypothetical protein
MSEREPAYKLIQAQYARLITTSSKTYPKLTSRRNKNSAQCPRCHNEECR